MAYFTVETARQQRLLLRRFVEPAPRRIVLRGRVVTMNASADVIADGMVCIQDDRIARVGVWQSPLPAPFTHAPVVDTGGSIYPGLIELHNHPAYNVIPMWSVPQHFENRSIWRANDNYKRLVSNPGETADLSSKRRLPQSLSAFR